jgi:16S rRNA processing protein RimM
MEGELLAVGRIARAHGVRGEVAVKPLSEVEDRFSASSVLLTEDGRSLTVRAARPHQAGLLVRFEGVDDRDAAEALRGQVLLVPAEEAPDLPEGSYWPHQLIGLQVVTEEGRSLGAITEVAHNPANDVWTTDAGVLVPAVREFVVSVEPEAGRVIIRDVPGLAP